MIVFGLALALPGAASANPPQLLTIDQVGRHPIAQFSITGADDATIYIATKPDRASDGSFLQENITDLDPLTTDEIQRGVWTYESQLDPGTYYVLLYAVDFDCIGQPTCLNGYSNVLTLHIPKPPQAYRGGVSVLHYVHLAYLTLRVKPLGEQLPYKVCWRLKNKRRRCVGGTVEGYSWNQPASDDVTVGLRGMAKRNDLRLVRPRSQGCGEDGGHDASIDRRELVLPGDCKRRLHADDLRTAGQVATLEPRRPG